MGDNGSLKEKLKDLGYKLTKQREAILDVFERGDKPLLTAQELFERVIERNPGINFSTVYRNLEILVQEGLVLQVDVGREAACYELNRSGDHHHHLICKSCGKVQRTNFCPFKDIPVLRDFVPTDHRFEIYGFCKKCLESETENKA